MANDGLSADLASLRIDRGSPPPSASRPALRRIVVAAAVSAVGVGAWRPAWVENASLLQTEVRVTEIARPSPEQDPITLTSTGYLVPQVQVVVSSQIGGRIAKTFAREGNVCAQGQLLFELDAADARARVSSAQAHVAAARARVAVARAQLAEVQVHLARDRELASHGALPNATVEDGAARAASLDEQLKAAGADVTASLADEDAATLGLVNTVIRSSIRGTVMTKVLQAGDVVSPGTPMATVADFDSMVVEADVPEGRLHLVTPGDSCEVVLDAYPDRHWDGIVTEISPRFDRAKATATVKVRMKDRDEKLLPDMAARVSFLAGPRQPPRPLTPPRPVVPSAAVRERMGTPVVFAVDSGRVHQIPVRLGSHAGDGFELLDGPAVGAKLVLAPDPSLVDGQGVKEVTP